ncbi:hypothetical protein CHS0354_014407, partial [Potamilus streckersoni]
MCSSCESNQRRNKKTSFKNRMLTALIPPIKILYKWFVIALAYVTLVSASDTIPGRGTILTRGDVMVAGIFSVQENRNGICSNVNIHSVKNVEAIRWYIDNLNSQSNFSFKIGFVAYKTCRIRGKESESINDVIAKSRAARDSKGKNQTYIVGVIGPETNSEAEVVSSVISYLPPEDQLLQIGFSTTAPILANRTLFPNLYRVIPNDMVEVKAIAKTVNRLGWTRIAIVHESDIYREELAHSLKEAVEVNGICVSVIHSITVGLSGELDVTEIQNIFEDIQIKSINGVVFFGTANTAKVLMAVSNSKPLTSLPIFFMSKDTYQNEDVFYDRNGLITNALGSYSVGLPFKEIKEFETYWTSLSQNTTKLSEKAQTNPWLLDAFTYVPTSHSIYVRYALIAAHAILQTLISIISSVCTGQLPICSEFLDTFKPEMMSEKIKMRNISFYPTNDFLWKVQSLNDTFSFDSSGEIVFESGTPRYELFNFRKVYQNNNDIKFVKIGNLSNDELKLDTDIIRNYGAGDREMTWPNIRRAECPIGQICRECISPVTPDLILHIPGDLYVVGLVPVHDKDGPIGCSSIRPTNGYQLVQGIKYALDKFNPGGEHSTIFGGSVRIGLLVLNTCNSELIVRRKILEIHSNGVPTDQGRLDVTKRVIGYIGDIGTSVSIASDQILSQLGYVQISPASSSSGLNDRNEFPYFMRVSTPDNKQARVMIELIKQLNSEYIQLVYSNEPYGQNGRDALLSVAKEMRVCIVQPLISIQDSNKENFFAFYEQLRRNPHAKIVIVFVRSHLVPILMATLTSQMKTGEFIFIGSATWGTNSDMPKLANANKLIGSFTFAMELPGKDDQLNAIKNMFPEEDGSTPWMQQYLESKLDCYFNWSFSKDKPAVCSREKIRMLTSESWFNFSVYASESLLLGAGKFLKSKCSSPGKILCENYVNDPRGLVEEIKNVSLDLQGTGHPIKLFDGNGDGTVGYKIYNIQLRDGNILYENVGQYQLDEGLTLLKQKIQYPNDLPFESPCPNELACKQCFPENHPLLTEDNKKPEVVIPVLGALVGMLAALVIGLIVRIIIWKRKGHDPYLHATYNYPYINPVYNDADLTQGHRPTPTGSCNPPPIMD